MRTKPSLAETICLWPVAWFLVTPYATQILRLSVALALSVGTVASAQTYRVLKSFTKGGIDCPGYPKDGLVLAGNTLYGTARGNGTLAYGGVFRINTDGSGFAVLRSFDGTSGLNGPLVLEGTTLYGSVYCDFNYSFGDAGGVFKISTDGTGYAVLKTFVANGWAPADPVGNLVLADGTLYGTTAWGGGVETGVSAGVVFKVNTDGSGYTDLKRFSVTNGYTPEAGLVLAGNTLYGTTYQGGSANYGVVFKINTDGSGFAVLKNFTGNDGAYPFAGLVVAGGKLYGTTSGGGSAGLGVVFKVNTDGSGYEVLKNFTANDGGGPSGLVLDGGTLYGTTPGGGSAGAGTVFKVSTDGSGYKVLKNFTGSDGERPFGSLVVGGGTLYGTTAIGGTAGAGVVFSLAYHLSIKTPPSTQTAETGSSVQFAVQTDGLDWGLGYQWFIGETNALVGATNAFLILTNVQPAQLGAYHVVVAGMGLAVTSAPAMLVIIPAVDRRAVPAVQVTGGIGSSLHVEYTDSLVAPQWSSVSNLTLTGGPEYCFDLCQSLPAQRFYRGWQTNGIKPVLNASMATEIPLTGAIGSSVRVDYINAIGPTNAWVTLDTVLLTNSPQVYYDLTAFRQPARLYRLVPLP